MSTGKLIWPLFICQLTVTFIVLVYSFLVTGAASAYADMLVALWCFVSFLALWTRVLWNLGQRNRAEFLWMVFGGSRGWLTAPGLIVTLFIMVGLACGGHIDRLKLAFIRADYDQQVASLSTPAGVPLIHTWSWGSTAGGIGDYTHQIYLVYDAEDQFARNAKDRTEAWNKECENLIKIYCNHAGVVALGHHYYEVTD